MVDLEKLLELFECDTPENWSAAMLDIIQCSGFSHALYGIIPSKTMPFETAFLKSNYPEQWRKTYDKSQYHYVDPVVLHCLTSTLPIAWDANAFQGREQQEFYEQASGYGLRSGISFPVRGALGEFGMLSFVNSETNPPDSDAPYEALARLALIRDYVLESSIKFLHAADSTNAVPRLTPRELECLKWVMAGKSSWEISQILRCSEATINFHVSNLKKKFNVRTRQQAVVKAIKERLIVPG